MYIILTSNFVFLGRVTMANYVLFFLVFALCVVSSAQSRRLRSCHNDVHNVIDYGAVGDGDTDDTKVSLQCFHTLTCSETTCACKGRNMFCVIFSTFLSLLLMVF